MISVYENWRKCAPILGDHPSKFETKISIRRKVVDFFNFDVTNLLTHPVEGRGRGIWGEEDGEGERERHGLKI